MEITKEQVLEALKEVKDPELKRDIVSLGMLRNVEIQGRKVAIHLSLTTPSAKVHEEIRRAASEKVSRLWPSAEVQVEIAVAAKSPGAGLPKSAIPGIRHVIAVASGKGGVGKTTVAVNLALALVKLGYKVGLMDADIYGPNVPLMLGISHETRPSVSEEDKLIPIEAKGLRMISMGVLVPPDQPMVWRGPMLHSAVTQFLQKVVWGELDFLLADLPPGTGDVQLSLVQSVPLSGAVIVTTPQEVALLDVRKGIAMFRKTQVPILGVIENMSGEIFGSGGGEQAARDCQAPFLGRIGLDARIRQGGDAGNPILLSAPDAPAAEGFMQAARELAAHADQGANLSYGVSR